MMFQRGQGGGGLGAVRGADGCHRDRVAVHPRQVQREHVVAEEAEKNTSCGKKKECEKSKTRGGGSSKS